MANDEIVVLHSEEEKENADIIGDQVPMEVHELSTHIDAKLRVLSPLSPPGIIFKVHELLRNVNAKAYEPHILAIGPYHRSKNHLSAMEEHKLRYLKQLLELKGENNTNKYVSVMWELKGEARACYVDPVDLKDDEFVEMMLLDACFIVELLRKWSGTIPTEIGDPIGPILRRVWIICNVIRDILLVENQLPLFVLQKFFEMTQMSNEKSLCHMIVQLFNRFGVLNQEPVPKDIERYSIHSAKHLLGLLHMSWTRHHSEMRNGVKASEENSWTSKIHNWIVAAFICVKNLIISGNLTEEIDRRISIPCATQLKEAGIKFEKDNIDNLFAVKFKNGIMKIPTLLIDDNSESLFRNLIAYEQFFRDLTKNYITDYIILMGFL